MIDIKEHFIKYKNVNWLVAGKGPSFDSSFVEKFSGKTIALNHTFLQAKFDYLHCIDWDVFLDCEQILKNN